jgi:hypothetical protein
METEQELDRVLTNIERVRKEHIGELVEEVRKELTRAYVGKLEELG